MPPRPIWPRMRYFPIFLGIAIYPEPTADANSQAIVAHRRRPHGPLAREMCAGLAPPWALPYSAAPGPSGQSDAQYPDTAGRLLLDGVRPPRGIPLVLRRARRPRG